VLVAVCLHDSQAEKKCPEKCPSFTSPVCAKGQDIPPKTFKNSCEMGIYTCKNNVRKFAEIDAPTDASTTTHSHHCTLNILPLQRHHFPCHPSQLSTNYTLFIQNFFPPFSLSETLPPLPLLPLTLLAPLSYPSPPPKLFLLPPFPSNLTHKTHNVNSPTNGNAIFLLVTSACRSLIANVVSHSGIFRTHAGALHLTSTPLHPIHK
ncbi:unnamed protein product, partial [Timema podura]|nr:unnamed protein product [Timema podura]